MPIEQVIRELIATGAAVATTNPAEVKFWIARARQSGATDQDLKEVIEIAQKVRVGANSKTDLFAESLANTPVKRVPGQCRGGGGGAAFGHPGDGSGGGCGTVGAAHKHGNEHAQGKNGKCGCGCEELKVQ